MAMHSCEFSYLRGEMTSDFIEERYDFYLKYTTNTLIINYLIYRTSQ